MFLDEFPYPFKIQPIDVPNLVLETIKNLDILFLGENHVGSTLLLETQNKEKSNNKLARLNSLNQENIYFHLINSFSKIYQTKKKCLWLEYPFDNSIDNLDQYVSHYYLIKTAKAKGWTVFFVDDRSLPLFSLLRDYFMAEKITQTIKDGLCDKGIIQNGMAHLSGYKDYLKKHDIKSFVKKEEFLNELLKKELENKGLVKTIDFLIMENWTDILRTREDVLSVLSKGQRDFSGWNLTGVNLKNLNLTQANFTKANLKQADLSGADLRGSNFYWANLKEASLSHAKLIKANLSEADLSGADFSHADLTGADLTWANLNETNFDGALLDGAKIDFKTRKDVLSTGTFKGLTYRERT